MKQPRFKTRESRSDSQTVPQKFLKFFPLKTHQPGRPDPKQPSDSLSQRQKPFRPAFSLQRLLPIGITAVTGLGLGVLLQLAVHSQTFRGAPRWLSDLLAGLRSTVLQAPLLGITMIAIGLTSLLGIIFALAISLQKLLSAGLRYLAAKRNALKNEFLVPETRSAETAPPFPDAEETLPTQNFSREDPAQYGKEYSRFPFAIQHIELLYRNFFYISITLSVLVLSFSSLILSSGYLTLFPVGILLLFTGIVTVILHQQKLTQQELIYQNALTRLYQDNPAGQIQAVDELCALAFLCPKRYQEITLRKFLEILSQTSEAWYQKLFPTKPSPMIQCITRYLAASIDLTKILPAKGLYRNFVYHILFRRFYRPGTYIRLFHPNKMLELQHLYLAGCDFSGLRVAEIRFVQCQLSQTSWLNAEICDAVFQHCQLDQADLRESGWTRVLWQNCLAREMIIGNSKMLQVNLKHSNLQGIQSSEQNILKMQHCMFQNCDLTQSLIWIGRWAGVNIVQCSLDNSCLYPKENITVKTVQIK